MRIGEAMVPGPSGVEDQWALGSIKPTGLSGKATAKSTPSRYLRGVRESFVCTREPPRFRREMESCKCQFNFVPGAPAPLQCTGLHAVGGTEGFLTTVPFRPVSHGWDHELHSTGRIHAATFQIGDQWIGGGVIYGQACQPNSRETKQFTNSLLQEMTRQLVDPFPGPAFVAGDWNQEPGHLEEEQEWVKRGWCDIQTWAEETLHIPPGPTCRFVSRKDFVYISPALQSLIRAVFNQFDHFPDHSTLRASMTRPMQSKPIPRWRSPHAIPYDHPNAKAIAMHPCAEVPVSDDPTVQYQLLGQHFEAHVDQVRREAKVDMLVDQQKGRANTMQRDFVRPHTIPIKASRQGEFTPTVSSWSMLHKQWVTQLRRLQSFQRAVRPIAVSEGREHYKRQVWHAIMHAPGFPGGFHGWWTKQSAGSMDWPSPASAMPDHANAHKLYLAMKASVEHLETTLKTHSTTQAKKARQENPNLVFQDVKRPRPVPVQVIISKVHTKVLEVPDEAVVESTDGFTDNKPCETRGGTLPVLHVESDQVWFKVNHGLAPGDVVAQVDTKGDVEDIHHAFIAEWKQRWDRHRHRPADRWSELVELSRLAFTPREMKLKPLTLARWKKAIRSKKHTAATGMDAISRRDMLAMPDVIHEAFLKLFNVAETQGIWPLQLLQGAVHSLEKGPGAETTGQFRPITVMPFAYRVWSSLRARELIHFLTNAAPRTLHGKAGSNATTLWWTLQLRIEVSLYCQQNCNGIVTDVIKAFNMLPREPVFATAKALGVSAPLLTAWTSATTTLARHFYVRGAPSMPVQSCTGFVEGCGLSVAAMTITNMLIHRFMELRCPHAVFTSYVDNYEVESTAVATADAAIEKLDQFCALLDISLDRGKTYRWATHPNDRMQLRTMQHEPTRAARDLGGHLQYTGQQSNFTVVARLKSLEDFWRKLATSRASRFQKVRLLRTVAWPRGLHGSSIVHLGPKHFETMRTNACRAIGVSRAGANPQIQLSLLEHPVVDPECIVIMDSILQCRRNDNGDLLTFALQQCALVPDKQKKPGPAGVLITRLHSLGWQYHVGTQFLDQEQLPVDVLHSPIQEVKHRFMRSWTQRVGALWEHRKDFKGLAKVSAVLSKPAITWNAEQQGLLRSVMNGTQFTSDAQSHYGEHNTRACKRCGYEEDSIGIALHPKKADSRSHIKSVKCCIKYQNAPNIVDGYVNHRA